MNWDEGDTFGSSIANSHNTVAATNQWKAKNEVHGVVRKALGREG